MADGTAGFEALNARTGPLLWLGALVGLWTAGSFIETVRGVGYRMVHR